MSITAPATARNLLRFLTAGSVDDEKSTLIGRLLHDSGRLYEDELAALDKRSSVNGKKFDPSHITDGLKAEREQGSTIDVAYRYFATPRRKFIIADTPGHEQYTRNMITGASTAHVAVWLIDARKGLLLQTRRHVYIARLLGLKSIIVALNKMDLVGFDREVFAKIRKDFLEFAAPLQFQEIQFIPMSALESMIDLHTHSTCSDGTSTPVELLQQAARAAIRALAITDHDTLAGFDAARSLAEKHDVQLLCGIEISTQFERPPERKMAVYLLGYFPGSLPDEEFRSWLISISSARRQSNLKLMEMLHSLDIRISWQDFPESNPGQIARAEFANFLVAKGYVSDIQTAFDRFLDDSIIAGIAPELPSTQKAIQKIHENGGVVSLAHPARLRCSEISPLESLIKELARHGLDAIEAYHSDHSTEQIHELLHLAAALNLLITGGSDYHGRHKPNVQMGTGRNGNLQMIRRFYHNDDACCSWPDYRPASVRTGCASRRESRNYNRFL